MFQNIKNKFKEKDNKVLLSNFFSLSVLQMATYLFPLLTFPYLVRVLGAELFGVLAMGTALVMYFQVLTDYGFDLSATKAISINRDNRSKLIEIFSSVMMIKFILMMISFILLSLLIFTVEMFTKYWEVYYFTFGLVIGQVLFPIWFFQGIEKMKYITVLTVISKLIFTLFIFIFIKEKEDFILVPLLNAIGVIITGLIALYVIRKDFKITFKWQKIQTIKIYFKDGWHIFMQRFYVNLYSTTNIIILGFLTNDTTVGLYTIATRIIDIFRKLFRIISSAYYPYFAKKFTFNPKSSLNNLKKVSFVMFVISFIAMIFMFIFDELIVELIAGNQDNQKILDTLQILSMGIILLPFFSLFTTTLVAINQSLVLNIIARDTALISLLFVAPLIYYFEEKGLAYLMLSLQVIIIFRYTKVIFNVNKNLTKREE